MKDLIKRKDVNKVIDELEVYTVGRLNTQKVEISVLQLQRIINSLKEIPTACNIENITNELESFAKLAENRWTNGTSNHAYQEHKCWVKAIDIVESNCFLKKTIEVNDICRSTKSDHQLYKVLEIENEHASCLGFDGYKYTIPLEDLKFVREDEVLEEDEILEK